MKRILAICLTLLALLSAVPTATAEDANVVRGFVIADDVFRAMEETFRLELAGEMSSIALSETQMLAFRAT